jgi:hypothetical protein
LTFAARLKPCPYYKTGRFERVIAYAECCKKATAARLKLCPFKTANPWVVGDTLALPAFAAFKE